MKILNKIIVWGDDNYNTLSLIRQIGQAEASIFFLIFGKVHYAFKSRYCSEYKEFASNEDILDYIITEFKNEACKPIIIASGDKYATFIDRNKSELSQLCIVPGTTENGLQEKYSDKINMAELAERIGILCPQYMKLTKNSDITDWKNYPCIVKPSHEIIGRYTEFKYKICRNQRQLSKTLQNVRKDSIFILQDYICREKDILVYGTRTFDGEIIIAGHLETSRFAIGQGSSFGQVLSGIPEGIDINDVGNFLEAIDYHGIFSFEYGLCDNKYYFFEVNLRNDATAPFFYQAGANIPLTYVCSCAGVGIDGVSSRVVSSNYYIDEVFDISNVILGKVTVTQWKQERKIAFLYKYYDETDPIPYKLVKRKRWLVIIKDIFIQAFRPQIIRITDLMCHAR